MQVIVCCFYSDQNCYHCLLVLRQHNNLIQYKESK